MTIASLYLHRADDNKTATAEFTCGRCDKKETVDAKVTEDTSNSSATCTEAGEVVYTATVEFEGKEYTDTKTVEVEALVITTTLR